MRDYLECISLFVTRKSDPVPKMYVFFAARESSEVMGDGSFSFCNSAGDYAGSW